MKRLLLVLLTCIFFWITIKGQILELEEVWVECYETYLYDSVLYIPEKISFRIKAINNVSNDINIGSYYIPYNKKDTKYGYFEIEIGNVNTPIKLTSKLKSFCIPANDTIMIWADLSDDSFVDKTLLIEKLKTKTTTIKEIEDYYDNLPDSIYEPDLGIAKYLVEENSPIDFNSFSGCSDYIIKSEIYYRNIIEDYMNKEDCDSIFPCQKVNMNNYFIFFSNGDKLIFEYFIDKYQKIHISKSKN